jgi:hypothetical protein
MYLKCQLELTRTQAIPLTCCSTSGSQPFLPETKEHQHAMIVVKGLSSPWRASTSRPGNAKP